LNGQALGGELLVYLARRRHFRGEPPISLKSLESVKATFPRGIRLEGRGAVQLPMFVRAAIRTW